MGVVSGTIPRLTVLGHGSQRACSQDSYVLGCALLWAALMNEKLYNDGVRSEGPDIILVSLLTLS